MSINILILCSTNTSLSPLFHGILELEAQETGVAEHFTFRTAGTHAGKSPRPVERRIRQTALRHGIDLPQTNSHTCTAEEIRSSDLILVMTEQNFWHVKELVPELTATSLRLLMEFSGQLGLREMPDPIFDETSFEDAFHKLKSVASPVIQDCLARFNLKRAGKVLE